MSYSNDEAEVKKRLAAISNTDAEDWYLVFKARYGMEVAFREIRQAMGDGSVLTQAFTCSTAVSPIITAGLTPRYADIETSTMMIDPDKMEWSEGTRAVVVQHTFGIAAAKSSAAVASKSRDWGAVVVEDSAHALGMIVRDSNGRPVADVSIHSFGVEKMLGTRFGAAVWVNPDMDDTDLRDAIGRTMGTLPVIGKNTSMVSRAFVNQNRVLNRLPHQLSSRTRKMLADSHLMEPPIAEAERAGHHPYEPSRPSGWMLKKILSELDKLNDVVARRTAASSAIMEILDAAGIEFPDECRKPAPYIRFPLFATTENGALRASSAIDRAGFMAGRWYRPLLFPGVTDENVFQLSGERPPLPVSRSVGSRVLNLLTNVSVDSASRAADIAAHAIKPKGASHTRVGNDDFVPVILGTGLGAYAMARSFHADYGIRSLAIGRAALRETRDSEIIDVRVYPSFGDSDFIVDTLLAIGEEFAGRKILLIPAIEFYTNVVMDHREAFGSQFLIPLPDKGVVDRLISKTDFYATCEKLAIPHPETMILSPAQAQGSWIAPSFGYPAIVKPADTDLYQRVNFEGKKKIFKVDSESELRALVTKIFESDYQADLVLQEFLSGDEAVMRVANTYSDQEGHVNFLSAGQVILTELNPRLVGNNNAIATIRDDEMATLLTRLLSHVGYRGLANFDLMYDTASEEYKVLEANLRAGATHYYVAAAGSSLVRHLVEDMVYGRRLDPVQTGDGGLWVNLPYSVVRVAAPDSLGPLMREARARGLVHTLEYDGDINGKRLKQRRTSDALRVIDTLKFSKSRLNK